MAQRDFSDAEKSIIKNMMLSRSHKDIAGLLDASVEDVAECVTGMVEGCGNTLVTYQMKLDQRASLKPKPVPKVKSVPRVKPVKIPVAKKSKAPAPTKASLEKQQREMKRIQRENEVAQDRKIRRREPEFPTKNVDYSKLKTVRVDARTFIYVSPGDDVEVMKEKYLNR